MPLPSCVLSSLPPSAPLYPVASRITRQILISSSSAASSSSSSSSSTSHSNHAIDSQRYKGNEYQLDENLATLSSIKVASSGPFNDLITFPYRGIPGFPALCGSTLTNTDQPPIYVFQYPGGKSLWRVETENDGYITTELYSDRLTEWWQFLSSLSSIDKPSIILDLTAQKELDLLTSFCYYPPTRDEQLIFHPIHSIDQSDFNLNIQLNDV